MRAELAACTAATLAACLLSSCHQSSDVVGTPTIDASTSKATGGQGGNGGHGGLHGTGGSAGGGTAGFLAGAAGFFPGFGAAGVSGGDAACQNLIVLFEGLTQIVNCRVEDSAQSLFFVGNFVLGVDFLTNPPPRKDTCPNLNPMGPPWSEDNGEIVICDYYCNDIKQWLMSEQDFYHQCKQNGSSS